ncbi:hypothetical protein EOM60_01780 [Candidatus Saccharibacteria bacterium]|nr:hypothetical protein [Candidatus Saccharibacteria bacterium]
MSLVECGRKQGRFMGLQISAKKRVGYKIASLIAIFAVVAQPMYGLVAERVASAESVADIIVNATAGDITAEDNIYSTINEAIVAASNNNVISIESGEYNEKVSITKNITLRGEAGAIINGPANSQAIEVRAQDNVLTNVTVSNLTVNAGANSLNVINVSNGDGSQEKSFRGSLTLRNLNITGNGAPAGIGLMQTDGVTIDDVAIDGAQVGIEGLGVLKLNMTNSIIKNSAIAGVNIWHTTGYGTYNPGNNTLNFTNNTFTNNATGLKITDARNVVISGGTITGGQGAIIAKNTNNLDITGVTISGQTSSSDLAAIYLTGSVQHTDIIGNTIEGASSTGATAQAILIGDSTQASGVTPPRYINISGNTIEEISGYRGGYGLMVNRPMSSETGAHLKFNNNTVDTIHGNQWMAGIGLDRQTPSAEITGNTFSNLSTNSTEWPVVAVNVNHRTGNGADVSNMTIKQNNFNTPGQLGVNYDWAVGTSPAASKYLDASGNYWGDLPGPAKGTSAIAGQYVTYSNWLCVPGQSTLTSDNGESKGCVQPIVTSVEPGQGGFISGTQRVYINVSNPEVMKGGFLQLNKATPAPGVHPNDGRTNYPIKQEGEDKWYAEIDTENIVALNGSSHQGDGKYLFRVEAHHKYGHSGQHPWGNYGNNSGWTSPDDHFVVDNTAPATPVLNQEFANGYFKPGNRLNSWNTVEDPSGIKRYEIAYKYDSGRDFGKNNSSWTKVDKIVDVDGVEAAGTIYYTSTGTDTQRTHRPGNADRGKVTIWVRAVDGTDNVSPWSLPLSYTIDVDIPVVEISTTPDGKVQNGTAGWYDSYKSSSKVKVNITDANPGTTKVYRASDDVEVRSHDGGEFTLSKGLVEGVYYMIHTDKADRPSNKVYFAINNTAPRIYDVVGLAPFQDSNVVVNMIGENTATVNFKADDNSNTVAPVEEIQVKFWLATEDNKKQLNGAVHTKRITDINPNGYTVNLLDILGDKAVDGQKYVVELWARNTAQVNHQPRFIVQIDVTAPSAPIITGGMNDNADTIRTISGIAAPNTLVRVTIDDGVAEETTSGADGSWSVLFAGIALGNHTVRVMAVDVAGNESEVTEGNFEVEPLANPDESGGNLAEPTSVSQNSLTVTPVATPLANIGLTPANNPAVLADENNTTTNPVNSPSVAQNNGGVLDADDNRANADAQSGQNSGWSLANLVLVVVAGIIGLVALSGLGKKEGRVARILAVAVAVGAVSAFLIKEDMSQPMGLVNLWTIAFVAVPIAQIALLSLKKDSAKK